MLTFEEFITFNSDLLNRSILQAAKSVSMMYNGNPFYCFIGNSKALAPVQIENLLGKSTVK